MTLSWTLVLTDHPSLSLCRFNECMNWKPACTRTSFSKVHCTYYLGIFPECILGTSSEIAVMINI